MDTKRGIPLIIIDIDIDYRLNIQRKSCEMRVLAIFTGRLI